MNGESVFYPRIRYSRLVLFLLALGGLSIMLATGCGVKKPLPATLAFATGQMAPPSSVVANSTVQFAAIVSNDTANLGVSWLLTCASANASDCGSISRHTASGAPTTFIAPASAPPGGTVTIEANASTDPSQSVTATIAITPIVYGPISVAFSPPPPARIPAGTLTGLVVVVTNDHLDSNGHPLGYTLTVTCAVPGTCGSVVGSTYVSPSAVPPGGTVTFTATSVADTTKSASVTVTIDPPTVIISLVQVPPASISAGAATNIGAMVTDGTAANAAGQLGVDWSVACGGTACGSFIPQHTANDVAGGGPTLQKITSYTAPSVVPPGGTVTVTATSTADPTKQASVTLTVIPATLNNGLLKGQYAFLLSGVSVDGTSALAGSVIADGNGNITAGEEALPGQTSLVSGITGSYFVGSDGRGTITLCGLPGFGFGGWLNGQQMLAITVVDSTHVFMQELDGSGNYNLLNAAPQPWYGGTLRGVLELQHASDFSVRPSGPYAFAWVHGGTPVGRPFAAYYGGAVNADASGNITSFWMDRYVDGKTDSILSGIYGLQSFTVFDSFGHGTVKLGPYSLHCFLVDSEHMIVLARSSLDNTGLPAGHLYSQSPVALSLAGTYMFTLAGSTPNNSANGASVVGSSPQAMGGWFVSDSSGSVNGYLDTNSNGTIESAPVSGTLAPSVVNGGVVSGRFTLILNGGGASQFAVYPTVNHGLLMFQVDTGKSGTGTALVQPLPSPTFQGTYAVSIQQLGIINSTRNPQSVGLPVGAWSDVSGQVIASGSSNITGTLDVDQVNGLYLAPSGSFWTQTPGASVTGSFTASAQARFPGSITTTQLGTIGTIFYVVDNSTVMALEVDVTPAVGILELQNF